jgi:hypothetical protein
MIAFVPVSRYVVQYQVASGRPYSDFERLLLEAVQEGQSTLGTLVNLFQVHRRVIIEGLVTLMQAGWIAVKADSNTFELTRPGKEAIQQKNALPPGISIASRSASVVMERVANQVALSSQVLFYPRNKIEKYWSIGVRVTTGDLPNAIDPGMVADLLPRGAAEWVKWIGPIDLVRDSADFAVVDVDIVRRRLSGPFPERWQTFLADELIARAGVRHKQLETSSAVDESELRDLIAVPSVAVEEPEERGRADVSWTMARDECRLVVGSDAHERQLERVFREASSYIAVASSFLAVSTIKALLPFLKGALGRGVLIDVLWGQAPDPLYEKDHLAGFEFLRKLEEETVRSGITGKLNIARKPLESHAKILLSDGPEGVRACVGSFNWFAARTGAERRDVSLWVKHPIPVARLCHLLADFGLRDERLSTGSGAVKLRNFAADLSSIHSDDPYPMHELASAVAGQLIIDRRHEQSFRHAVEQGRNRVVVASHRLRADACNQLLPLLTQALEQGKKLEVTYGIAESDPETLKSFSESLTKLGGTFSRAPDLHGKYVVVDDATAIIGSYNWLNGSEYARRRPGVEVGISLSGATVGGDLLSACAELSRPPKKPLK